MSFVGWPGELHVGVPLMDADHEELVATLNELHDVLAAGGGRDGADLLLRFIRFAREHFVREEAFMVEHRYPASAEHTREHGELLTVLSFLLDAMRETQLPLDTEALAHIRQWLCGHIENSDAALAHFVLRKG